MMKYSSTPVKKSGGANSSQGKYKQKSTGANTQKKDRPSSNKAVHQKMY